MHFDAVVTNRLPIPKCKKVQQEKIITLVDQILEAKKLDSKTNTSDFEKQIDELVYELYGLTEQEIKIIESK